MSVEEFDHDHHIRLRIDYDEATVRIVNTQDDESVSISEYLQELSHDSELVFAALLCNMVCVHEKARRIIANELQHQYNTSLRRCDVLERAHAARTSDAVQFVHGAVLGNKPRKRPKNDQLV